MLLLPTLLIGWILCGVEMDMFVPSLPELQEIFQISPFVVELTIGVNCIAHLIGALVIGSVGDKFGYRIVIVVESLIFCIGSAFCCFAMEYDQLLFGRFLQGAGIASTTTISYLVLTNIYSTKRLQEIVGLCNGIIGTAVTFAPVIGSYIAFFYGWRGNFAALFALSIINLLGSYFFIPYHPPKGEETLSIREYKKIFRSKATMYYIMAIGTGVTAYWVFVGIAPILYMQALGVELSYFGLYQGSLALVYCTFSFANGFLIRKFGTLKCTYFGCFATLIFTICVLCAAFIDIRNPLIITGIMMILSAGIVMPSNILYPLMFDILPSSKGKTSAVLTALKMIVVAVGIQIAIYFYKDNFFSLGITLSIITCTSLYYTYKVLITQNEIKRLD